MFKDMFKDIVTPTSNVEIIARERGKLRRDLHREDHNVWVNIGRQYLAEALSPLDNTFSSHYSDSAGVKVAKWVGVGIGGDEQTSDVASLYPSLDTDYPGGNTFSDEGASSLNVSYLERPVKVTGTPGVGSSPGVWMNPVQAPPAFSGTPVHVVEFVTMFSGTDLHLSGAYPSVPLSECALMLSNEVDALNSDVVYDYTASPYIGASRQRLIAYNAFATITKTLSVDLEIHWKIEF